MELARARVYVSGIVQGVFFRSNTRGMAKMLNVRGWIRNTTDGGVDAVFEGEKENIVKMINFCKNGPGNAVVRMIDVKWEKFKGEFKEFEIR